MLAVGGRFSLEVQSLVEDRASAQYFTLDDAAVLTAVAADPSPPSWSGTSAT
jgi:hypothetical protein